METIKFRLGTTSYIIPDEIVPNVRYLAGKTQDIELILFEVDEGPSNLLHPAQQAALASLAQHHGMSYTVHLPLDLNLAEDATTRDVSFLKAKKAIDCTIALNPWAYVLHLEGKQRLEGKQTEAEWLEKAVAALEQLGEWVGDSTRLAVENLDHYPPEFISKVFERSSASRCIDIGHLWLEGYDPLPYLEKYIARTRVIHIHGISDRDHSSLKHVEQEKLRGVINFLHQSGFDGVMTVEVFNEEDFVTSLEQLDRVFSQLGLKPATQTMDRAKPAKYHRDLYGNIGEGK